MDEVDTRLKDVHYRVKHQDEYARAAAPVVQANMIGVNALVMYRPYGFVNPRQY